VSARIDLPSGLVTFLFTDIEGSTRLAQLLGDDYRSTLQEHRAVIRSALSRADGHELFTEGDSLFVAFADAGAALRACVEAQRGLTAHPWSAPDLRPKVRMGLHSGYAVPRGGEYTSAEVHRAARVAAAAHGGQVLCSAATARLASNDGTVSGDVWLLDLGLHRLRGFDGRERLLQVVAPGLDHQFPRPRTDDAPAHNLPIQPSRFIGRGSERAELRRLVAAQRLVTVVGPGGAGKTRLAVEVAGDLIDRYPDGVWFVDLSSVADASLVDVAAAEVLGLRPEPGRPVIETVVDHLAGHKVLLVLDTCDALPSAARRLAGRILAAAPSVTVLATSREPVRSAGEVVWRIPPLRLVAPPVGGYSDAVALLVDRASAARGGRPTGLGEIPDFGRIATALDGLPLALELAAARLRILSAAQLAARIDDVLGTLDAGCEDVDIDADAASRHRTMQATVTWSYRTLGTSAAWLLRRLAVFAGPVDLPAIEWLHGGDPLDPLATLVDKSLLQAEPGHCGATYRMLDPIRAYAARRLAEAEEEAPARDRHVDWCLNAVDEAQQGTGDRTSALSLYALDPLADELRAALRWTVTTGSVRKGFSVVAALSLWWRERGLAREGRMWLFRLYDRVGATGALVPDAELAQAYHLHAMLAGADGEHTEELRFSQRAEELAAVRDAALTPGRAGGAAPVSWAGTTRPSGCAGT
jgi:predicted ATPase/class 3 adenylate cyclase